MLTGLGQWSECLGRCRNGVSDKIHWGTLESNPSRFQIQHDPTLSTIQQQFFFAVSCRSHRCHVASFRTMFKGWNLFFPTCQVRVVRFYQSCRLLLPPPPPPPSPRLLLPPDLNYSHPRQVLAAGPQPRPSQPSVGCRTPTTASPAQCWLPDLNHGHPGAVLAAGPQPPCQI